MATLSSLVEAIARIEGVDPLQVGWIARQLREAELIRKGGRGRGGARMQPDDAVNLLIGVNATGSPKEAVAAIQQFRPLLWNPKEKFYGPEVEALREDPFKAIFRTAVTFAEVLESLILMAVPVFKPKSELQEALEREGLEISLDFIRPVPLVQVEVSRYEPPSDDEDVPDYYVVENGVFAKFFPRANPEFDRTDRVRITHKTLLEVGKTLAS